MRSAAGRGGHNRHAARRGRNLECVRRSRVDVVDGVCGHASRQCSRCRESDSGAVCKAMRCPVDDCRCACRVDAGAGSRGRNGRSANTGRDAERIRRRIHDVIRCAGRNADG